jgi:hypothetical protein
MIFAEIIINMKIKKIYDKKMNNINLLIDKDNFIYLE